jgi:hypothetical protein
MSLAKKAQFNFDDLEEEFEPSGWEEEDDLEKIEDDAEVPYSDNFEHETLSVEEDFDDPEEDEVGADFFNADDSYAFDKDGDLEDVIDVEEDLDAESFDQDDIDLEEGEIALIVQEEDAPDDVQVYKFDMSFIPGADIEEEDDLSVEEEEDEVEVEEKDMWDWRSDGLKNFLPWLQKMINMVPSHSGRESAGIERAIAYLETLNKCISQAVRSDLRGEIDIAACDSARNQIDDGVHRLESRLKQVSKKNKKKKAGSETDQQIVKEAQKITGIKGIVVTVPLLISTIARVCINGSVSGGHDIEDIFEKQCEKYKLDDREQTELMQLLEDMGQTVNRDRGYLRNEEVDKSSSDNFDWNA